MFAKTIVDISDCHTVLNHLDRANRLGVGDAGSYAKLCQDIAAGGLRLDYAAYANRAGVVTKTLNPAWQKEKFWYRLYNTSALAQFPLQAWKHCVPVRLKPSSKPPFLQCTAGKAYGCSISPVPSILVFPFGWSASISLQITGPHDLESLAAMMTAVFNAKAFNVNGVDHSLDQVLDLLAEGAREDAFLGAATTADTGGLDGLVVATVLDRGNSMYSWRGLGQNQVDWLRRIMRPAGQLPAGPLDLTQVHERGTTDGNENYVVRDPSFSGVFIWMARLLKTVQGERNAEHLRCYHNNTNNALVFATQQAYFLKELLGASGALTPTRLDLLTNATNMLTLHPYQCAALHDFLDQQWVKDLVTVAQARIVAAQPPPSLG